MRAAVCECVLCVCVLCGVVVGVVTVTDGGGGVVSELEGLIIGGNFF